MAPWYLFDSIIRIVDSINVALRHSLSKATGEGLGEKKAHFNYFDGSYIRGFGNAQYQDYSKTQWRDQLSRTR